MQRRKALSRLRPRSQACLIRLFVTNRRQTSGAFLRFWLIWRISRSYMSESAPELVALYGLNRHHTLQLLRRIKLADLEKTAFHPELQKNVTVAEYVDRIGTHGANHLQQIERLKKETSSIPNPRQANILRNFDCPLQYSECLPAPPPLRG